MANLQDTNDRLAQPNEFQPDWDAMAVMVEEQQRMATEIDNLKRRLKAVNTAAMKLTSDLTCMDVDDDDRLDRDRVMERVMQWRNQWDKAMHNNQPEMQPCAGRNCGSTNPNLHSAECFEDYEKSTGVVGQDCDCPYLNIHDAVVKDNDKALSLLSQCLDEMQYAGWNKPCADQQGRWNVFGAVLNYLHPSIKSDT